MSRFTNTKITDWRQRRKKVYAAFESLADGVRRDEAIKTLRLAAGDEKWEVRLSVAERLLAIPDPDFDWFAERLSVDNTSFVRTAAEQAIISNRQSGRRMHRRQQECERLEVQTEKLEQELGKTAANLVRRLRDRHIEQFVGTIVHDLRGVLTYLKASCHALIRDPRSRRQKTRIKDQLMLL